MTKQLSKSITENVSSCFMWGSNEAKLNTVIAQLVETRPSIDIQLVFTMIGRIPRNASKGIKLGKLTNGKALVSRRLSQNYSESWLKCTKFNYRIPTTLIMYDGDTNLVTNFYVIRSKSSCWKPQQICFVIPFSTCWPTYKQNVKKIRRLYHICYHIPWEQFNSAYRQITHRFLFNTFPLQMRCHASKFN